MLGGLSNTTGVKAPKLRSRPKGEYAVRCDGTDDYVEISDFVYATTGDFTISFWIKKASSWDEATSSVFGHTQNKSNSIYIGTKHTGTGRIFLNAAVSASTIIMIETNDHGMEEDKWYHLAFVVDRSSASDSKIYIDGEESLLVTQTISNTTTSVDINGNMRIAANIAGGVFDADYKDFMIHSAALSQKHIKKIYQHKGKKRLLSISRLKDNLELYLPLGDGTEAGSGTTVYDMSGNGRNGTLNNGATYISIDKGELK